MSEGDTFKFAEETLQELDELKGYVRIETRKDTIRYALKFLRHVVDETQSGGKLWVEREEKMNELIPFWDERFQKPPHQR